MQLTIPANASYSKPALPGMPSLPKRQGNVLTFSAPKSLQPDDWWYGYIILGGLEVSLPGFRT